ncbi:MAG: tRNA 2-thiouridine(34) synthase MnmA [Gammaproteobacteria bacterium]|nr:tRNA 2-thiouridine(34) synthase MnmA [Gammaproteobacteria bacterium]
MPANNNPHVIVGMSGGVDSSVAALLLHKQGFRVQGLFMKNWEEDDEADYCAAEQDLKDAEQVCKQLGIALHKVNFSYEYWERVFKHFLTEYRSGRTPNPDILCNKEIKFKAFLEHALTLGANRIATGHYARISCNQDTWSMHQAVDRNKDQSYFLYTLGQKELSHSLFPLGGLEKNQVRSIALEAGLPTHAKKDSTGICFIGERRFRRFLERFLPAQPGDIVTPEQELVGRHQGVMYYTIGQRQGLGIGGRRSSSGAPWYVVGKDIPNNRLIVVQGHDDERLFHKGLYATQLHWIHGPPPGQSLHCTARIRYRQSVQDCHFTAHDNGTIRVMFDHPQRAITPGQAIVFYQGDLCLGGGTITEPTSALSM